MGRLACAAVALLTALALGGCTSAPPATPPASGHQASGADPSALPAGFYGLENARTNSSADGALIEFPADCEKLLAVLDASSWTSNVLVRPTDALSMYMVALQREGHTAVLNLHPGMDSCRGTLTVSHPEKLTLSGTESVNEDATFLAFGCQSTDTGPNHAGISGFYDLPNGIHLYLVFDFAATIGKQDFSTLDDPLVSVMHGDDSMLTTIGGLLAASLTGADVEDSSGAGYIPGDDFNGSITVTSIKPLTGTINLTGLVDSETGAPLSVKAGFRCSK